MKIIITEEQYGHLVTNLLELLLGDITIKTVKEKKEVGDKSDHHSVFSEDGYLVMTIWVKGKIRNKGCKKDLTLESRLLEQFEQYMPYYKHKMFSKVLVDYIYNKFGIKCDCVQYDYGYEEKTHVDDDGDEYVRTEYKTKKYNVKKKKKIKESANEKSDVENLIYGFLQDDFYPDYNWGPELFDFYREDVEEHGMIPFYINDSEGYVYYDDGTLEIMPWVCKKLNEYFNDLWVPVFKDWFEEHSGLKVDRIVDSSDNNVLLSESVNNSNVVEQIMEVEGIKLDSFGYGGRTYDSFMRKHDSVDVYFKFPNDSYYHNRRIHFLTRNNKVIAVDSAMDFRTITDGFRYIPTEVLMPYFIEKAKTYLERILPYEYPNDNK
jgi:hypothetical protein